MAYAVDWTENALQSGRKHAGYPRQHTQRFPSE